MEELKATDTHLDWEEALDVLFVLPVSEIDRISLVVAKGRVILEARELEVDSEEITLRDGLLD